MISGLNIGELLTGTVITGGLKGLAGQIQVGPARGNPLSGFNLILNLILKNHMADTTGGPYKKVPGFMKQPGKESSIGDTDLPNGPDSREGTIAAVDLLALLPAGIKEILTAAGYDKGVVTKRNVGSNPGSSSRRGYTPGELLGAEAKSPELEPQTKLEGLLTKKIHPIPQVKQEGEQTTKSTDRGTPTMMMTEQKDTSIPGQEKFRINIRNDKTQQGGASSDAGQGIFTNKKDAAITDKDINPVRENLKQSFQDMERLAEPVEPARRKTGSEAEPKTVRLQTHSNTSQIGQDSDGRLHFRTETNNTMTRHVSPDTTLKRIHHLENIKGAPRPQSINLMVESEGLGKIALRVAVHNHLVRADFVVDHMNSLAQIQSGLSDLFSSLYREGLMPEDFSFYLGQNNRDPQGEPDKEAPVPTGQDRVTGPGNRKDQTVSGHYNLSIKA